jgi:cytidylate kinase
VSITVTISREYGAAALAVARALEERTGFHLVEDQITAAVATRLQISEESVVEHLETPPPLGERILSGLLAGVPEIGSGPLPSALDLGRTVRSEIEATVRTVAERGDAIIVGWIANMILGPRPDVLRVFLHAPLPWRIARIMESFHFGEAEARREVERVDSERRTFAKTEYRLAYGDPHQYDLVLDTARFGIGGAADVIADAVRVLSEG